MFFRFSYSYTHLVKAEKPGWHRLLFLESSQCWKSLSRISGSSSNSDQFYTAIIELDFRWSLTNQLIRKACSMNFPVLQTRFPNRSLCCSSISFLALGWHVQQKACPCWTTYWWFGRRERSMEQKRPRPGRDVRKSVWRRISLIGRCGVPWCFYF